MKQLDSIESMSRMRRWIHLSLRLLWDTTPTILIIGAQKSGTTSLHNILASHDELSAPLWRKEIQFFERYRKISLIKKLYLRAHFPMDRLQKFESSPNNLYFKHVPELVKSVNPNMRMIVILREPEERAKSH